MDWSVETLADRIIGRPRGRVDESTWEVFWEALFAAVDQARAASLPLVLDISRLDYMSSRGLRGLMLAQRRANDEVAITLAAPNARMREVLAISRVDKLIQVHDQV
jgi:anti-sigma B factor antagonist